MRPVYLIIIVIFAAAAVIFAVQNLDRVTVSFLGFSVSMRLAVLVVVVYVAGAFTGGSLFGLLRRSYEGARRTPHSPTNTGAK
jgi:uncharacterized integral membrane protein